MSRHAALDLGPKPPLLSREAALGKPRDGFGFAFPVPRRGFAQSRETAWGFVFRPSIYRFHFDHFGLSIYAQPVLRFGSVDGKVVAVFPFSKEIAWSMWVSIWHCNFGDLP
ncbi:MAG: hypothetical protein ACFB11_24690 [Paracoccaceae bacterium]